VPGFFLPLIRFALPDQGFFLCNSRRPAGRNAARDGETPSRRQERRGCVRGSAQRECVRGSGRRGCVIGSGRQGFPRPRPSGDAPRLPRGRSPHSPDALKRRSAYAPLRPSGPERLRSVAQRLRRRCATDHLSAALPRRSPVGAPCRAPRQQSCRFLAARGAPDRRATRARSTAWDWR